MADFFDLLRQQRGRGDFGRLDPPVPILRPFEWFSTALTTFRERPLPGSYLPNIVPTIDTFGTSRASEVQYAEVLGPLATIEVLHGPAPVGYCRHYLAFQAQHTDSTVAGREMVLGRVVTAQGGGLFPFVAVENSENVPDGRFLTARNVLAPPESWVGARVGALAAGTRIQLRMLWIEFPVGESHRSIT